MGVGCWFHIHNVSLTAEWVVESRMCCLAMVRSLGQQPCNLSAGRDSALQSYAKNAQPTTNPTFVILVRYKIALHKCAVFDTKVLGSTQYRTYWHRNAIPIMQPMSLPLSSNPRCWNCYQISFKHFNLKTHTQMKWNYNNIDTVQGHIFKLRWNVVQYAICYISNSLIHEYDALIALKV